MAAEKAEKMLKIFAFLRFVCICAPLIEFHYFQDKWNSICFQSFVNNSYNEVIRVIKVREVRTVRKAQHMNQIECIQAYMWEKYICSFWQNDFNKSIRNIRNECELIFALVSQMKLLTHNLEMFEMPSIASITYYIAHAWMYFERFRSSRSYRSWYVFV